MARRNIDWFPAERILGAAVWVAGERAMVEVKYLVPCAENRRWII